MATAHHEHPSTLLTDGTVLVAGGYSVWPAPTSSAEFYHPAVLMAAPSLFSLSGDGKGQGAIWDAAGGQMPSPAAPAVAGQILSMYTTTTPVRGSVIPPQVAIGGRLAEVLFFGEAPGYPGFNQVNFRVPGGVPTGPSVPVLLTYIGRFTGNCSCAIWPSNAHGADWLSRVY